MNKERNNTNNTNITALDTKSTGSNVNDDANSLKRKISTVSTEAKIPGNQLQQSTPEKYAKIARISHIPLGINKELSVLHDLQLIEYLPVERIRALLKSGQLREKWQNPSYNQEYATKNYKNEVDQIKTYLSKYDRHLKGFKCKMFTCVVFFTFVVVANSKMNCKPGTGYRGKGDIEEFWVGSCPVPVTTQSACESRIRMMIPEAIVEEVDSSEYSYGCVYFKEEMRAIFNKNKESKKTCTGDLPCICDYLCLSCHRNQYSDGGDTQCFECPKDKPYSFPRSTSNKCRKNLYNLVCKEGQGLLQESVVYDRRDGYCEDLLTEEQCKGISDKLYREFKSIESILTPHGCYMNKNGNNFWFNKQATGNKCSKESPCKCAKRKCGICSDGSHAVKHPVYGYECKKCPVNYYSTGGQKCKPCEDGTTTSGRTGQTYCGGVSDHVRKKFDAIQAMLNKQKEVTNDLSVKSLRLWQKEQIRLNHDKMMESRKRQDAVSEGMSCTRDQMHGTVIFPALEVSEEIEKLEDTTCLSSNRDELLGAVCDFTSNLDEIFETESIKLSAKSFFPNICCKERSDSKLHECSDPEGKIKRENIVPFALSQGGQYNQHNLYAEVTDSIKYNGYLHKGITSLIASLKLAPEIKTYVDSVFKGVSLCGPRHVKFPHDEKPLCQLFLPYRHTMNRFLEVVRNGIELGKVSNNVFLQTVEHSMLQRGKASGRLGKVDVQSMLNMKPLKNAGEKKCTGGSQFVSSELKKMKKAYCNGYKHVDLQDKRIKNIALHFLKDKDVVPDNREMERLVEKFRYQVVDTSCPAPLLSANSISIQSVKADPLKEEKVWVAIAKLDSQSDDGYLQSQLPFCEQKDYLIGAKIEIKLYDDESNCCNGMRDYDECMQLHDTVLIDGVVKKELKCSGRLPEIKDGDGRHFIKTIDVTGTQFTKDKK
eukprot:g13671.t1